MRVRIRLDTTTDVANFVLATSKIKEKIYVTDGNKLCINGKSFLGLAHAREFTELWCECEKDIYTIIEPFVVTEAVANESN